jgi:hypothetical protein
MEFWYVPSATGVSLVLCRQNKILSITLFVALFFETNCIIIIIIIIIIVVVVVVVTGRKSRDRLSWGPRILYALAYRPSVLSNYFSNGRLLVALHLAVKLPEFEHGCFPPSNPRVKVWSFKQSRGWVSFIGLRSCLHWPKNVCFILKVFHIKRK